MSKRNRKQELKEKEQRIIDECVHADPQVEKMPLYVLLDRTIDEYNSRENVNPIDYFTDQDVLDRMMVNYARHWVFSGYDTGYNIPLHLTRHDDRKERLLRGVYNRIKLEWPSLAAECDTKLEEELENLKSS